jgi:bacteriophage N4 adsorption protein B
MLEVLPSIAQELWLYAACGMLLFGIDDVLVDLVWLWSRFRGRLNELRPQSTEPNPPSKRKIAVFVPAWQEAGVIGDMLDRCLIAWKNQPFHIFVGTYPNDPATIAAVVARRSDSISIVRLTRAGPTTKADCLNGIWATMLDYEREHHFEFAAILLHDAEDHVHEAEIWLFSDQCQNFDLIQIPVVPDVDAASRWIAGHYLDEFAEAHHKELNVRQYLGASVPSAGTGCALSRAALVHIASQKSADPFDDKSLTEDYELGLHFWQANFRSRFIRTIDPATNTEIVVRSCFPNSIGAAVRQKTRWIMGIALAGWDRVGWHGTWTEHWMRWRDRRAILAATLILAGYIGTIIWLICFVMGEKIKISPELDIVLRFNFGFLAWRLANRAHFTSRQYGWREGLLSVPRFVVSNIISVMSATRAVIGYLRLIITGKVVWDKTQHVFPTLPKSERR